MSIDTRKGRLVITAQPAAAAQIKPEVSQVTDEFRAACARFREVCREIGSLISNPDFKGGFDEMSEFETHPAAMSVEGIALSIKWIAADKLCTYLASKLGIGQPEWWHTCWMFELPQENVDDIPLAELEL